MPTGIDIAHYFIEKCSAVPQSPEGYNLYRQGSDYCYIWNTLAFDLDYQGAWLLEVRTSVEDVETRDFLFVSLKLNGARSRIEGEWFNNPITEFKATWEQHCDYMTAGMDWFNNLCQSVFYDTSEPF